VKLLRNHPVFSGLILLALVVAAVEVWLILDADDKERDLVAQLDLRIAEIERLQRRQPAPNEVNLRNARDDFVQNALVLSSMLRSLNVAGADELEYFQGEPTKSTDAYFDIAQFVERMQQLAAESGVTLKPDERFGFSTYTNVGPEAAVIRPVYRQRRIAEYLLRALFAARPKALISVQREVPVETSTLDRAVSRPAGAAANTPGGGDFFVIDPQVSARTPDYVATMAFRLSFAGQTSALRGFVNALSAPEIPLVVRSVEVEPYVAEATGAPGRAGPPAGLFGRPSQSNPQPSLLQNPSIPIVAENVSRFVVTVELFEVKIRPPELEEGVE
jgi:hypothetical protein